MGGEEGGEGEGGREGEVAFEANATVAKTT